MALHPCGVVITVGLHRFQPLQQNRGAHARHVFDACIANLAWMGFGGGDESIGCSCLSF